MADGKKPQEEEQGDASVGLWYVSFSDMITLLLSFFVMLSTFSTYDKGSLEKIHTAWAYVANYSVIPGLKGMDGLVPPSPLPTDARQGSEKPTAVDPANPGRPGAQSTGAGSEAYSDRRMFYVPSNRLFWGKGCSLIQAGRGRLKTLAAFMRVVPCQLVIGESNPADGDAGTAQRALERAWTLVEYFTGEESIPADRFRIVTSSPQAAARMNNQPVVVIMLLARSL
jgi:flagellar motor protein MotB